MIGWLWYYLLVKCILLDSKSIYFVYVLFIIEKLKNDVGILIYHTINKVELIINFYYLRIYKYFYSENNNSIALIFD